MEAVTFQQICIETEKFAPVLNFTRVENPNSEICLNMVPLCQDGFLYHDCISLFQPFQQLRCAVTFCILSNQEDSPRNGQIVAQRHVYFKFLDFANTQLFQEQTLSAIPCHTSSGRLFSAICFQVKIQDSRPFWKKELEIWKGLIKCHCSFLVALQRFPRQDTPWPFQQGKSRKGTASNGCAGS